MFRAVRRARNLAFAGIIALGTAGVANANFTCYGPITYLGVTPNGVLYTNIGFGVWQICNVSGSFTGNGQTFTADACRAWYAAFLAAKRSDTNVVIYFESSAAGSNPPECTALGNWVMPNPSPYFFIVQ